MFVSDLQEQERPQLSGAVGNPSSHLTQGVLKQRNSVCAKDPSVFGGAQGRSRGHTHEGWWAASSKCHLWVPEGEDHPMLTGLLCGQTLRDSSQPVGVMLLGASFALTL